MMWPVLREVCESSVLLNLKKRFQRDCIYVCYSTVFSFSYIKVLMISGYMWNSARQICVFLFTLQKASTITSNLSILSSEWLCHIPISQTYIGNMLLSVNPFKPLNIYSEDLRQQYQGRELQRNPP